MLKIYSLNLLEKAFLKKFMPYEFKEEEEEEEQSLKLFKKRFQTQ